MFEKCQKLEIIHPDFRGGSTPAQLKLQWGLGLLLGELQGRIGRLQLSLLRGTPDPCPKDRRVTSPPASSPVPQILSLSTRQSLFHQLGCQVIITVVIILASWCRVVC